mmetsp:Transcript_30620/g.60227  ORF Transcript_30620/g.60227 Transcript_30620/m.60227 type:complete len:80 (-) Transcript_30620:3541-3780(-)
MFCSTIYSLLVSLCMRSRGTGDFHAEKTIEAARMKGGMFALRFCLLSQSMQAARRLYKEARMRSFFFSILLIFSLHVSL